MRPLCTNSTTSWICSPTTASTKYVVSWSCGSIFVPLIDTWWSTTSYTNSPLPTSSRWLVNPLHYLPSIILPASIIFPLLSYLPPLPSLSYLTCLYYLPSLILPASIIFPLLSYLPLSSSLSSGMVQPCPPLPCERLLNPPNPLSLNSINPPL